MTRGKRKQRQRSRTSRTMSIEPLMNRELLAADLAGAAEGDTSNHNDDIVNAFTERIDNSVAELSDGELLSHELLRVEQQKVSSTTVEDASRVLATAVDHAAEVLSTDADLLDQRLEALEREISQRAAPEAPTLAPVCWTPTVI